MYQALYVLLGLFFLSLTACESVGSTASDDTGSETAGVVRSPERWIEFDGQKLGWYHYEQLKPLLEIDNDTTYVVNFWATWCKPCIEELPAFQQLYETYKNQKVHLILVSLDFEKQLTTKLIPYLNKHNIQGEVPILSQKGMNDWIEQIHPSWTGALPATLIYQGSRRQFFEQSFEYSELEVKLKQFMNIREPQHAK